MLKIFIGYSSTYKYSRIYRLPVQGNVKDHDGSRDTFAFAIETK